MPASVVTADRPTAWKRIALEAIIVAALFVVLAAQLLSYPPTFDPDLDGSVGYARHLAETGRLPESVRLPGYPAFLVLASAVTPRSLARNAYWLQLAATVAFVAAAWIAARRWAGPLTATLFLAIIAAPSFFARMSVVMLPDGLHAMLLLPVLLAMCWWVLAAVPRGSWLWLVPFALGLFVIQMLRPTTAALTLLLLPALALGLLVHRRVQAASTALYPSLTRLLALATVALLTFIAVDALLDTGARAHNASVLRYRIVTALPPADASPPEQRIEAAKARFREQEGQHIERARFLSYLAFRLSDELEPEDVQAVWLDRLRAHPGAYLASVMEDIRLGHYLLVRTMVPFFLDLDRVPLFRVQYPPDDDGPVSRLFRQTGLIVLEIEPNPANYPLEVEAVYALLQVLAVWGLTPLGIWRLGHRYPGQAVAFTVTGVLFIVLMAAISTVEPRNLLPMLPLIYLCEAAGLAWIARSLLAATGPRND